MLEKTLEYQMVFLSMGRDHTITIVLLYQRGFLLKQLLLIQVLSSPSPFIAHFAISYLHHFHAMHILIWSTYTITRYSTDTCRIPDSNLHSEGSVLVDIASFGAFHFFFPTSFLSILVLASSFLCRVICFDQSHSVKKNSFKHLK